MTILLTCGPAWEPLDEMRRLTNASTGLLGSQLADVFVAAGHRVVLFRGEGSTARLPRRTVEIEPFSTNDDLADKLSKVSGREPIGAVLHAAALCDFKLAAARGPDGSDVRSAKIPSRGGRLTLELEPATKVLPRLREWFPHSRIVGWKYELNGSRPDALTAARRQLKEAATDACILNGRAWGPGFALCDGPTDNDVRALNNSEELGVALIEWLASRK